MNYLFENHKSLNSFLQFLKWLVLLVTYSFFDFSPFL
jgi:hypothetical protein